MSPFSATCPHTHICVVHASRHSKTVFELNAQQKLLEPDADVMVVMPSEQPVRRPTKTAILSGSSGGVSVKRADATAKPTASVVRVAKSNGASAASAATKTPMVITADGKPVRRVLPEHEGRYKITLPAGTTQRSKEILQKKAMRMC